MGNNNNWQAKPVKIALGLIKMNKTVIKNDTPQIRGMIKSIEYLLKVKEM